MELTHTTYSTSTTGQLSTSSIATKTANQSSTEKQNTTASSTRASDSYVSSSETTIKGLYSKPQKLTDEQIQALKHAQTESKKQLIASMTEALFTSQSRHASSVSNKESLILTNLINAYSNEYDLPELATDPEEAAAALTGDGPYSIDSVATRIMDMAVSLAGNDPEKLEQMRSAVQKGFEQAGMTFSDITGESKLPQICQDTYTEIMNRFDDLQSKLQSTESKEA